jgi:hypothetical protein
MLPGAGLIRKGMCRSTYYCDLILMSLHLLSSLSVRCASFVTPLILHNEIEKFYKFENVCPCYPSHYTLTQMF